MEKLGRLVVGMVRADEGVSVWDQAARWVRPPERGGLGLGGLLVFGGEAGALRSHLDALVAEAGRPLILCADYERGAGQQVAGMTLLPHLMALGAADDLLLCRRVGAHTGREARALGINLVFAPCSDLASDPRNPIIDVRAFGDDPERVAQLSLAWLQGLQTEGVLGCAKHYPGHGDVAVDSHIAKPVLDAAMPELEARELVPFRVLAAGRAGSFMTAHMAVPALTGDERAPVTVSAEAIRYLREELAYDGLVFTDALLMGGLVEHGDENDGGVQALAAGCDVLLAPSDPAALIARLEAALAAGEVNDERVRDANARIDRAFEQAAAQAATARGALDPEHSLANLADEGDALAKEIASRGLARVRGGVPPKLASGDAVVVTLAGDAGEVYPALAAALAEGSADLRLLPVHPGGPDERLQAVREEVRASAARDVPVAIVVGSAVRAWKEHTGLPPREAGLLRALVDAAPNAAVIALGSPRLLVGSEGGAGFRGAALSDEPPTQRAVAAALLSGSGFEARAPLVGAAWRELQASFS